MNSSISVRFVKGFFVAITAGLFTLASISAKAELLVAISCPSQGGGENDVLGFDSSSPGTILFQHPITGVIAGETIRGIDFWNGTVYALGSAGNLYSLNYNTGEATVIAAHSKKNKPNNNNLGVVPNGASFGFENDSTAVRIVSELGQNLTVDRTTGEATVGPDVTPAGTFLSALAYRSALGTMFGIDSTGNSFGTFNPATGVYSVIGLVGFDVARNNGFDISDSTGIAYLVSGASSSDLQANLYRINLATGLATLVGLIGNVGDNLLLRGLTVVPTTP